MRSSRLDAAQRSMSSTALRNEVTASARPGRAANSRAANDSRAARTLKMFRISLLSRWRTDSRPRAPAEIRPSCCSWRIASRKVRRLICNASDSSVSTRCVPGANCPDVMAFATRSAPAREDWSSPVAAATSNRPTLSAPSIVNIYLSTANLTVAPARSRRSAPSTGRTGRAGSVRRPQPEIHQAGRSA